MLSLRLLVFVLDMLKKSSFLLEDFVLAIRAGKASLPLCTQRTDVFLLDSFSHALRAVKSNPKVYQVVRDDQRTDPADAFLKVCLLHLQFSRWGCLRPNFTLPEVKIIQS